LLTVTDGVFPLVLCLYYVHITLTFSICVFNCTLSIFNKRILLLFTQFTLTVYLQSFDTRFSVTHSFSVTPAYVAINNISLKTTFFSLQKVLVYLWRLKCLVTLSTYRHYINKCIYPSIYLSIFNHFFSRKLLK